MWLVENVRKSKQKSTLKKKDILYQKNHFSITSREYECLLDLKSDTVIKSKFKTEKSISDIR